MRAFVTGTDTSVGKTYVTALLTRALRASGRDAVALKPVCSGDRSDAEILLGASGGGIDLETVNPFWFQAPLAPHVAAKQEGGGVGLEPLLGWYGKAAEGRDSVLVEGAGGWLVPLGEGFLVADLAEALRLPVVVVVASRLGCVNHTLLTLESLRARNLECAGLILNRLPGSGDDSLETNRELIEEFSGVPVVCEISPGQQHLDLPAAWRSGFSRQRGAESS